MQTQVFANTGACTWISISALGNRHFGGVDHTESHGELSQETYNFLRFLIIVGCASTC